MSNVPRGSGYGHLFRRHVPPRGEDDGPRPDPSRLRLFAVEASIADARRALARARGYDTRHRAEIAALEDLVGLLSAQLLKEASGS